MIAYLALSDAVVSVLRTHPALAGAHISRGRRLPLDQDVQQAIHVRLQGISGLAAFLSDSYTQWQTTRAVELMARAQPGSDGEQAIDELLATTWARLAAATPPAGATGWALDSDVQWDVDEADQTLVRATLTLRVTHITTTATLTAAA
jgi:hypothetical protein